MSIYSNRILNPHTQCGIDNLKRELKIICVLNFFCWYVWSTATTEFTHRHPIQPLFTLLYFYVYVP
jgi:hypothetical protein